MTYQNKPSIRSQKRFLWMFYVLIGILFLRIEGDELLAQQDASSQKEMALADLILNGELSYLGGNHEEAKQYLLKAVSEVAADKGREQLHFYLANIYTQESNYGSANKHYEQAVRGDKKNATYYAYYGHLKLKQKQYEVSQALYERAIELATDYGAAYEGLAHTYHRQKKYASCADLLEKVLHIEPNHPQRVSIKLIIERLREKAKVFAETEAKRREAARRAAEKKRDVNKKALKTGKESKSKSEDAIKDVKPYLDIVE